MLPDRVSSQGPLTYESGALPIALRSPADIILTSELISTMTLDVGTLILWATPSYYALSFCEDS